MKRITFGSISFKTASDQSSSSEKSGGFGKFSKDSIGNDGVDNAPASELSNKESVNSTINEESLKKKAQLFSVDEFVQDSVNRLKQSSLSKDNESNRDDISPIPSGDDAKEEDNDDEFIGPPVPRVTPDNYVLAGSSAVLQPVSDGAYEEDDATVDDSDSDDDSDAYEDEGPEDPASWVPSAMSIDLSHGVKPVSALALDPAGARVVTGSVDYEIRYWDFSGMNTGLRHFRQNQPFGSYPINDAKYSASGDRVVLVSGSSKVRVVDRDGIDVLETRAGDMYLIDMARTKGHTGAVNAANWHGKNREQFVTCSDDGTLRLWDVETAAACHRALIKPRAVGGLKARPTSCQYSRDGQLVAAGCCDGGVYMWDHRKHFVNTCMSVRDAHTRGVEITCLSFSYDNNSVLSRANDETLKLWDLRQFKKPILSTSGLFSKFSNTDCLFSPNDRLVVTATSAERQGSGAVHVFNRLDFSPVSRVDIPDTHTVRVVWHPRINQLVVGCGDGVCRVFYDPAKSHRGALLCSIRKTKVKQMEVVKNTTVITPHALRQFREPRQKSTFKQMQKARKDPVKSHRPDLPQGKSGTGGRVAPGGSTLASYVMRTLGKEAKSREEGDPREALLKHAKDAAERPYWVAPAYAKTQPKPIFQSTDHDEEEPEAKRSRT